MVFLWGGLGNTIKWRRDNGIPTGQGREHHNTDRACSLSTALLELKASQKMMGYVTLQVWRETVNLKGRNYYCLDSNNSYG